MRLAFKVAKRYIFPRKSINFISIITLISIIGIAVGAAALIIVQSIFGGFRDISENAMLGIDPPLRITSADKPYFSNADELISSIKHSDIVFPQNTTITAFLRTKAIIMNSSLIEVVELVAPLNDTIPLPTTMLMGNASITNNGIILGIALADRLKATVYDTFKLLSFKSLEYSVQTLQLPTGIDVTSTALFQSNTKEYDLTNAYVEYEVANAISDVPMGTVTEIDIKFDVQDKSKTDKLQKDLQHYLNTLHSNKYLVQSWKDLNRELYNIMQMERLAVFCILSLILLIASFNVFASLAMTVTEKRASIAILKAFGGNDKFITQIYRYEGLLIGGIGTAIGILLGVGLTLGQIHFEWIKIDGNAYLTDSLPILLNWGDVAIVAIFSMALSFIATIYPVRKTKQYNDEQLIQSINNE
jgi:lipoprotein-releasing system permease protein